MNFSTSILDYTQYVNNLDHLIKDENTIFIIDTNIIALIYKLYSSAQNQLFEWFEEQVSNQKLKVPVWVLNEYMNHFNSDKIDKFYFSPYKKYETIKKDYLEVKRFLKMNIDDDILNKKYLKVDDYLADLDIIEDLLDRTQPKKLKNDYYIDIHEKIRSLFEGNTLDSDINSILSMVETVGSARYRDKLPPGYDDYRKEVNPYGDLIIWFEILEAFKTHKDKNVILITNDIKRDWVQTPKKIKYGSIVKNNSEPIKIADSRLVYEFYKKTGNKNFHIIDISLLTSILNKTNPDDFNELANALQIVNVNIPEENEVIVTAVELHTNRIDEQEDIPAVHRDTDSDYSEEATSDMYFKYSNSDSLTEIINSFKSYNWYEQNYAIKQVHNVVSQIEDPLSDRDSLFVLGRNIYQAACGNAFEVIEYIKNLKSRLKLYKPEVHFHILNGILFEIYFDKTGEVRTELKHTYFDDVFELMDDSCFKDSFDYIAINLSQFIDEIQLIPTLVDSELEIKIDLQKENEERLDIIDISVDDKSLLIEEDEHDEYQSTRIRGTKDEIEKQIRQCFGIPKKYVKFIYNPIKLVNDEIRIVLRNKLLKAFYNE